MGLEIEFDKEFTDIAIINPAKFKDERGYFSVLFEEKEFKEAIGKYNFVQNNTSLSNRGVIRGLHYQIEHAQGKLVHVSKGIAIDVVVDIRKTSKNFGKWRRFSLACSARCIWIPPGYAHGFCAVMDNTIFNYSCTDTYHPEYERTILYCDPAIGIKWPKSMDHIVSDKDLAGKLLKEAEVYE